MNNCVIKDYKEIDVIDFFVVFIIGGRAISFMPEGRFAIYSTSGSPAAAPWTLYLACLLFLLCAVPSFAAVSMCNVGTSTYYSKKNTAACSLRNANSCTSLLDADTFKICRNSTCTTNCASDSGAGFTNVDTAGSGVVYFKFVSSSWYFAYCQSFSCPWVPYISGISYTPGPVAVIRWTTVTGRWGLNGTDIHYSCSGSPWLYYGKTYLWYEFNAGSPCSDVSISIYLNPCDSRGQCNSTAYMSPVYSNNGPVINSLFVTDNGSFGVCVGLSWNTVAGVYDFDQFVITHHSQDNVTWITDNTTTAHTYSICNLRTGSYQYQVQGYKNGSVAGSSVLSSYYQHNNDDPFYYQFASLLIGGLCAFCFVLAVYFRGRWRK